MLEMPGNPEGTVWVEEGWVGKR